MEPLLSASDLGISFGGLRAVLDFNLDIYPHDLLGLIGPNGAGKTTVFNLLTGVYLPTEGQITMEGKSIVGKKTFEIAQLGVARTFQNIRLFKNVSVLDNVKMAYDSRLHYTALESVFRTKRFRLEEQQADQKARALLDIFGLQENMQDLAKNMPYGKQRKLEIARALATEPKVLLLDEPAAGMNPSETAELMDTIKLIRETFDVAILLIEHDMNLVMGICERLVVLDYGMIIAGGVPDEIKSNPKVIAAYLGE